MVVPEGGEFRLCNTICEPTSERQNALKRLVDQDQVDLILAIGGRKSRNTARLAEVGKHGRRFITSSGPTISEPWLADADGRHHGGGLNPGRRDRSGRRRAGAPRLRPAPAGGIRQFDPDYVPCVLNAPAVGIIFLYDVFTRAIVD